MRRLTGVLAVLVLFFAGVSAEKVIEVKGGRVEKGEVFTIEPVTRVVVEGPWVIEGELRVEGTKEKKVVFDLRDGTVVVFGSATFSWTEFRGGKGTDFYFDLKERRLTVEKPKRAYRVGRMGGALSSFSELVCENCVFYRCGDSSCRAGGLYAEKSAELKNVKFIECKGRYGGGAFLGRGEFNLSHLLFKRNSARRGGGAFLASCDGKLEDLTFVENRAEEGGALYLYGCTVELGKGIFKANVAEKRGIIYVEDDTGSELRGLRLFGNGAKYGLLYFETSADFGGFDVVEDEDNRCVGGKEFLSFGGRVEGAVEDPYRYRYGRKFYELGKDLVSGEDVVVPKEGVALVVFMADWCGFCKKLLSSTVWKLKDELEKEDVKVYAVAVRSSRMEGLKEKVLGAEWRWFPVVYDGTGELAERWGGISGIPVSFVLVNGRVEHRIVGYVKEGVLKSAVEESIRKYEEERKVEQTSRSSRIFLSE